MHIFVWLRFLIIAAIANATKLDDEPLDIVVEDGLGKGWQENTGCVDSMARNGGGYPRHNFEILVIILFHHNTIRSKLFLLLEGGVTWSPHPQP